MLMTWRTTEFPKGASDSRVEVVLEPSPGGTRITLRHTEIPTGQAENYRQGWAEYYFEQMKAYFGQGFRG
jgi:activator of HSP90 ATPase